MQSRFSTKWIDCHVVPSIVVGQKRFYIDAVVQDGKPDVAASCVYSPLSVSGNNVFVREEISDSLKMAVLVEYLRESRAEVAIRSRRGA